MVKRRPVVRSDKSCGCRVIGCGTPSDPLRVSYCRLHRNAPQLLATCKMAVKEFDVFDVEDGWDWAVDAVADIRKGIYRADPL